MVFERYRDADAAIEHFSNIGHFDGADPGHRLRHGRSAGNTERKMREQIGMGGPKLFTPWIALQDQESAEEEW